MAVEPEAKSRAHQWLDEVYAQAEERPAEFSTISGHPVRPLYTEEDAPQDPAQTVGYPGEYPFTRGNGMP